MDGPRRHRPAVVGSLGPTGREPSAMSIIMIGVDTAKSVFQVHGLNQARHKGAAGRFFHQHRQSAVPMDSRMAHHGQPPTRETPGKATQHGIAIQGTRDASRCGRHANDRATPPRRSRHAPSDPAFGHRGLAVPDLAIGSPFPERAPLEAGAKVMYALMHALMTLNRPIRARQDRFNAISRCRSRRRLLRRFPP